MTPFKSAAVVAAAIVASPGAAAAALSVVTTTQDPAAITRAIGAERVEVFSLAKGFQDPHFLEAKPSFMLKLNRADLVEVIGLDLEVGYLGSLLAGARNDRIMPGRPGFLDLSAAIQPLEAIPSADRGQGDIHPTGNPHYWLDPENGRLMARVIAARLTELDPEGKTLFAENLRRFERELDRRIPEWQRRMAPLAGKAVVTYHRSWSYFAQRFGVGVAGFVEPKPGIPPSPAHTLEVIKLMRASGLGLVLMESFYDPRVPRLIAEKAGASVAAVPNSVGGEDGVDTYFDLFERITNVIARALRG